MAIMLCWFALTLLGALDYVYTWVPGKTLRSGTGHIKDLSTI